MKIRTASIGKLTAPFLACLLISCGGGGSGGSAPPPPPPPPPANESVGGIWIGTTNAGLDVAALIAENGVFFFVDDTLTQIGFGVASVSNVNQVDASYTIFPTFGFALLDGSTFATCTLSGTVNQRQSLTVTSDCTTELGTPSQVTTALTYDPLYERDASLATIAGLYDAGAGDVMSIDSTGNLFEQDAPANGGCVLNGQVTVIDPAYNAYGIDFTVNNCGVGLLELNGTSWSGIGTLDNSDPALPEDFVFQVTGNVTIGGTVFTVALVVALPRI